MTGARTYRWLAVLPALGILVGVPFVNRVRPFILGLPFLLFWILACVLLTSAVMAVVGALDRRFERNLQPAPAPGDSTAAAGRATPAGPPDPADPAGPNPQAR